MVDPAGVTHGNLVNGRPINGASTNVVISTASATGAEDGQTVDGQTMDGQTMDGQTMDGQNEKGIKSEEDPDETYEEVIIVDSVTREKKGLMGELYGTGMDTDGESDDDGREPLFCWLNIEVADTRHKAV